MITSDQKQPSAKDLEIARMLACGISTRKIAAEMRICRKRIWRLQEQDWFRHLVTRYRAAALGTAIGMACRNAAKHVGLLNKIATDDTADIRDRINAAKASLEYARKGFETMDLEQCVKEIIDNVDAIKREQQAR